MSSVLGLHGLSTTSQSILIAAYGNGFVNVLTGAGYGTPLSSQNNVEMESFLSGVFFQNYVDTPLFFDGSVFSRKNTAKVPLARYIRKWKNKLVLGFVNIAGTEYASRIWLSNLPVNNVLQWGYETGNNLVTIAGNTLVHSSGAGFLTYGLKRGDPIFILNGADIGQYFIQSVTDDQNINLTTPLKATASGISFWAGGNWLDLDQDDGDFITGLEVNNGELLIFKRDALHRYNGTASVVVRDAPGTTSGRSIVNIHEYTVYFHGSSGLYTGIYAYNGSTSTKISAGIEPWIQGINPSFYTQAVAWREAELYRVYVGNIVNVDENINIPNAVITFDYSSSTWSIDPIADVITDSTSFRNLGVNTTYLGNNDGQILLTPDGNTYNDSPVPWQVTLSAQYPSGTSWMNIFTKIEVYSENAQGVRVLFSRNLTPYTSDTNFTPLGQIDNEKTIFIMPERMNQSSGLQIRFVGIDKTQSTALIKKVIIYYKKDTPIVY